MRAGGGGAIVLVGSANGLAAERGTAAYNASKAALHSLAQTFGVELASAGVRVVRPSAPGCAPARAQMTEPGLSPDAPPRGAPALQRPGPRGRAQGGRGADRVALLARCVGASR